MGTCASTIDNNEYTTQNDKQTTLVSPVASTQEKLLTPVIPTARKKATVVSPSSSQFKEQHLTLNITQSSEKSSDKHSNSSHKSSTHHTSASKTASLPRRSVTRSIQDTSSQITQPCPSAIDLNHSPKAINTGTQTKPSFMKRMAQHCTLCKAEADSREIAARRVKT